MKTDQLSKTAAFIAIKFYGLTRIKKYRSLFDDSVIQFYEKLVQSLPIPLCWYHYWLKFRWVRSFYISCEEFLLPGDLMHILVRKKCIRRMADELVAQGYEQLVILGAGFDHLGNHYSQKGLNCFEFDAPHMAQLKRDFLTEAYPDTRQPKIIDAHFSAETLEKLLLEQQDLDFNKKTIIVAEGFFDYFRPDTTDAFFITINKHFSHNSALISTHFSLKELSFFHRRVFQSSVLLVGEQLKLKAGISEFEQMLSARQLNITQLFEAQEISQKLFSKIDSPLPMLKGFYVFMAKLKKNKR